MEIEIKERHKWHIYEVEKKRLSKLKLSPEEYELELAEVIQRLKL